MGEETLDVARRIAEDPAVRAVLICGNGPALTVGGDIDYFLTAPPDTFGALFARMTTPFHEAFRVLSRIDAPIVTAAHGAVAGGGLGYVYAADLVIAAENTRFVTAFAAIGLSGDGGGTWHLPRLIGPRRAAQAYLRNTPITASEALDWGLVNEVVLDDEVRNRAAALAAELAVGPTRAFARMRALLRETWTNDLSAQLTADGCHAKRGLEFPTLNKPSTALPPNARQSSPEGRDGTYSRFRRAQGNSRQCRPYCAALRRTTTSSIAAAAAKTSKSFGNLGATGLPRSSARGVRRRRRRHGRSRRGRRRACGARHAAADLVISPANICGSILADHASEDMKREWLPGIAEGTPRRWPSA